MSGSSIRTIAGRQQILLNEGMRKCSTCQEYRPVDGGAWFVFNEGRNRRWNCAACRPKDKVHAKR